MLLIMDSRQPWTHGRMDGARMHAPGLRQNPPGTTARTACNPVHLRTTRISMHPRNDRIRAPLVKLRPRLSRDCLKPIDNKPDLSPWRAGAATAYAADTTLLVTICSRSGVPSCSSSSRGCLTRITYLHPRCLALIQRGGEGRLVPRISIQPRPSRTGHGYAPVYSLA